MKNNKNTGLEVVRGLAAMVVVLNHLTVVPDLKAFFGSGVMLLNWGVEAVVVFFLLSGVVIRLSYDQRPQTVRSFILSRLSRLLPLYLFAVLAAAVVLCAVGSPPLEA